MTIQIRKATRKKAKLRLGVSAPSGAGKTLGALMLAYGIMRETYPEATNAQIWDKIGMIDTEEGSGELYVGVTKHGVLIDAYAYIRLSAPFTAVKYIEATKALEAAGIEVIIEDSVTHAWAGTGGLLEKHGRLTDNDPKKNSYTAWRHVTPDHTVFVDTMLQSPAHIIATMRSKVEYAQQAGADGKTKVVKLGMAPVQREGMEYEFTVFFDINDQSIAHATKDRTDLYSSVNASGFLEKREFMLTPAIGQELFRWLNTGIETIEMACERLVAEVDISEDLEATYLQNKPTFDRLDVERPEWVPLMQSKFEQRQEELSKNTAQAV
jgi:hypothetical protein